MRPGCPQQRMHPRLPNWRASRRCGQAAPSSELMHPGFPIAYFLASRRCGLAARSSECSRCSELEGFKAVRAAAANAPKIPNWKASRWSDSTQDSQLAAPRRCGKAARSSECTQDSQLEGFKAVQACCPQQRMHPRFPIGSSRRCGQAARSSERAQDSQFEGFKAASRRLQGGAGRLPAAANAPKMQRMHPRFSIGRLQGSAGRLPAAANAPQTPVRPKIPNSKASRQRGHAAANEPKIPN